MGFAIIRFEDNNEELKAARLVDLIVFKNFEKILLNLVSHYCLKKADFIDFFCTGFRAMIRLQIQVLFLNPIDDLTDFILLIV